MGYLTNYTMIVLNEKGTRITEEIKNEENLQSIVMCPNNYLPEITDIVVELKQGDRFYGLLTDDSCKWYDHEEVMKDLSKKHSHYIFMLRGEGEAQGDVWIKYFYNGRMETLKPTLRWPYFSVKEFVIGE
jgi:hypothetical protein